LAAATLCRQTPEVGAVCGNAARTDLCGGCAVMRIPTAILTYVPMARGFVYLAAVIDWFSRRILSWRLSITMEAGFRVEAVEEALARHGRPEIFNTDQGSQFTSTVFTGLLTGNAIAISMDGRGAWRDCESIRAVWMV
jgi:putative transposase